MLQPDCIGLVWLVSFFSYIRSHLIRTIGLKCIVCTQRCTACQWCIKIVSYMSACVPSIKAARSLKVELMQKKKLYIAYMYCAAVLYILHSYSDVMVFFYVLRLLFLSSSSSSSSLQLCAHSRRIGAE